MFNIKLISMPCCFQALVVECTLWRCVVSSMQLNCADMLSFLCTNANTLTSMTLTL